MNCFAQVSFVLKFSTCMHYLLEDALALVTSVLCHLLLALIFITSSMFDLVVIIGFGVLAVCLIFIVILVSLVNLFSCIACEHKRILVDFKKRKKVGWLLF